MIRLKKGRDGGAGGMCPGQIAGQPTAILISAKRPSALPRDFSVPLDNLTPARRTHQ
jgi:hypothetical protein